MVNRNYKFEKRQKDLAKKKKKEEKLLRKQQRKKAADGAPEPAVSNGDTQERD